MASEWGTLCQARQAAITSARQLESCWSLRRHPDGMGSGPAGIDYLNQFEFQLGGKRNPLVLALTVRTQFAPEIPLPRNSCTGEEAGGTCGWRCSHTYTG